MSWNLEDVKKIQDKLNELENCTVVDTKIWETAKGTAMVTIRLKEGTKEKEEQI